MRVVDQGVALFQWGRGFSAAERHLWPHGRAVVRGASMGPRLFSRGEYLVLNMTGFTVSSFNGAAAFQPRRGATFR